MGWKDYFGYGGYGDRRKGLNKSAREYNNSSSPAEKEKIYKSRMNIFNFLKSKKDIQPTSSKEKTPLSKMENFSAAGSFTGVLDSYNSFVYASENSKNEKIKIYREMARYPEIAFAIDEYVSEAINIDSTNNFMKLIIKNDAIKEESNLRKTLTAEWNYLLHDVIGINKHINRWFRDFIIDGEIGCEKVIDNENTNLGIISVNKLRTPRLHPIWDDIESDTISQFVYKTETNLMAYPPEAIAYANSGLFDYNVEEDDKIVLSILEDAKIAYRRLKQLEDALIIYRLVRAPERRVFNIDVSQLPKGKAEQYINELMTKYRQRKFWDSKTGQVSESLDVMAMTEDFWLPKFGDGRGHEITSLAGGENLGQIEDVKYFLHKLYRALKVPISRFEGEESFKIGNTDDVAREEVRFYGIVSNYANRFVELFKSIFFTHIQLKGIVDEFGLTENDFFVRMNENNLFRKKFEANEIATRFETFERFKDMMDMETPLFSREWVAKKYLEINDDEWDKNLELLEQESEDKPQEDEEGTDDTQGGLLP